MKLIERYVMNLSRKILFGINFIIVSALVLLISKDTRSNLRRELITSNEASHRKPISEADVAQNKSTRHIEETERGSDFMGTWEQQNLHLAASTTNRPAITTTTGLHLSSMKRQRIFIATIGRSGSKFLGQLLEKHKDVICYFEPAIKTGPSLFVTLKQKAAITTRHAYYESLFTCKLHTTSFASDVTLCSLVKSISFRKSLTCRGMGVGKGVPTYSPYQKAEQLDKLCLSKSHAVIKEFVSRLPLQDIHKWPYDMPKVVLLVRDPRAILQSYVVQGATALAARNASICIDLYQNIQYGLKYLKPLGLMQIYRYEDTCLNFESQITRLMKFVELEPYEQFSAELRKYPEETIDHTSELKLKASINKWRKQITKELVDHVETHCRRLMIMFGYKFVNGDEALLRNVTVPLFSSSIP